MAIKVECAVQVLESTEAQRGNEQPKITVRNHWNRDQLVVLRVGDQEYTVNGYDLIVAIQNAMRTRRYNT